MFMILKLSDGNVVQRTVRLPPVGKRRSKKQLRTRDDWARKMAPVSGTMGSRYFVFRHGGSWWRYDTVRCDEPVAMPNQEAAEMRLMHRG